MGSLGGEDVIFISFEDFQTGISFSSLGLITLACGIVRRRSALWRPPGDHGRLPAVSLPLPTGTPYGIMGFSVSFHRMNQGKQTAGRNQVHTNVSSHPFLVPSPMSLLAKCYFNSD